MYIPTTLLTQGGIWQLYTPVLTASVSDPDLGTGGSILGSYTQIGNLVVARVKILFGSAAVNGGSGTYRVTLPVTPDSNAWTSPIVGQVLAFDSSPSTFRIGQAQFDTAGGYMIMFVDSAVGFVSNTGPFTWAANDQIHINTTYESS